MWAFSLLLSLSTGAAITKYYGQEGLPNKYFFLTVLEAGIQGKGASTVGVSVRVLFRVVSSRTLPWLVLIERDLVFLTLFIRLLVPSWCSSLMV